jgi:diadenylate cyclase
LGGLTDWIAAAVEIAILAAVIYVILRFLVATRGGGFVRGLLVLLLLFAFVLRFLIAALGLERLQFLYGESLSTLVLLAAILFQPELRRGIARLGEHSFARRFMPSGPAAEVSEVTRAVARFARERIGALIAFERDDSLQTYVEGGVPLEALLDHLLLEAIFHEGGALHDGAVIVRSGRIAAAACLFPLTDNPEISKRLGTRHRAAIGITEEKDAVAVVVSEETGQISLAVSGALRQNLTVPDLEDVLEDLLGAGKGTGRVPRSRAAEPVLNPTSP